MSQEQHYQMLIKRLGEQQTGSYLLFLYTFRDDSFSLKTWQAVLSVLCFYHRVCGNSTKFNPLNHVPDYWERLDKLELEIRALDHIPSPFPTMPASANLEKIEPNPSDSCGALMILVGEMHDLHMHQGAADARRNISSENPIHSSAHMIIHFIHVLSCRKMFTKERDSGLATTRVKIQQYMIGLTMALHGEQVGTMLIQGVNYLIGGEFMREMTARHDKLT
jgi:hypothetical protein